MKIYTYVHIAYQINLRLIIRYLLSVEAFNILFTKSYTFIYHRSVLVFQKADSVYVFE